MIREYSEIVESERLRTSETDTAELSGNGQSNVRDQIFREINDDGKERVLEDFDWHIQRNFRSSIHETETNQTATESGVRRYSSRSASHEGEAVPYLIQLSTS